MATVSLELHFKTQLQTNHGCLARCNLLVYATMFTTKMQQFSCKKANLWFNDYWRHVWKQTAFLKQSWTNLCPCQGYHYDLFGESWASCLKNGVFRSWCWTLSRNRLGYERHQWKICWQHAIVYVEETSKLVRHVWIICRSCLRDHSWRWKSGCGHIHVCLITLDEGARSIPRRSHQHSPWLALATWPGTQTLHCKIIAQGVVLVEQDVAAVLWRVKVILCAALFPYDTLPQLLDCN